MYLWKNRKFLKWIEHKQNASFLTPYLVMWLIPQWLSKLIRRDLKLIKYQEGTKICQHVDNSHWWAGYDYLRTDVTLRNALRGGVLQLWGHKKNKAAYIKRRKLLGFDSITFRPDIIPHSVTTVTEGTKLVLSFGKLVRNVYRVDVSGHIGEMVSNCDIRTVFSEILRYKKDNVFVKRNTQAVLWPGLGMWGSINKDTEVVTIVANMYYCMYSCTYSYEDCLHIVKGAIPERFL